MDIYDYCEDCKYAIFHSEDSGYSPKECGLVSRSITYFEGCKKDLEPYYDEDEETIVCEGYKGRDLPW